MSFLAAKAAIAAAAAETSTTRAAVAAGRGVRGKCVSSWYDGVQVTAATDDEKTTTVIDPGDSSVA